MGCHGRVLTGAAKTSNVVTFGVTTCLARRESGSWPALVALAIFFLSLQFGIVGADGVPRDSFALTCSRRRAA